LASGDIGARDVTGATRSAGTTPTGVIKFWGLEVLAGGICFNAGAGPALFSANLLGTDLNVMRLAAGDDIRVLAIRGSGSATAMTGFMSLVGDD
jgi:hypothetical protein